MKDVYTIADVAQATGRSKQTVRRRAKALGLVGDMTATDGRGRLTMTAEQASALADAVTRGTGGQARPEVGEGEARDSVTLAALDALRSTVKAQGAMLDQARAEAERARAEAREARAEAREARAELEDVRAELERERVYSRELELARWWERRGVIARHALPPASTV